MSDKKWKIECNSCDATINSEHKHIMPEGWRWNKQDGHRCPACLEIDNAIVADNRTQYEIEMMILPNGTIYVISKGDEIIMQSKSKTLSYRVMDMLNAADGMTTEQAVKAISNHSTLQELTDKLFNDMDYRDGLKYIEHGAAMVSTLKGIELDIRRGMQPDYDELVETLAKLEVE